MKRGYLYILITTLLFSSMEVALKCIAGQLNPIQLNFSRFLVGGLVLVPLAVRELKKRRLSLDGRALGTFALLGLMGIAVSMSLYQLAVARVQASVVGVLFSSNPVFVTLFAFLLLREKISKNQILGLALDVIGIVLIIQPWHLKLDALGVTYILLGTLLFALYGVCGKRQCALRRSRRVVLQLSARRGRNDGARRADAYPLRLRRADRRRSGHLCEYPLSHGLHGGKSADRPLYLHRRDRHRLYVLLPVDGGHERADDIARVLL